MGLTTLALALLGPLTFEASKQFGVNLSTLTTPLLLASFVSLGVLPILVGRLSRHLPSQYLLRLGLFAVGVGCCLSGTASTPIFLVVAHTVINFGFVASMLAALSLSAELSRSIERGRAAAFIVTANAFAIVNGPGLLIGSVGGGLPDMPIDWRSMHFFVALLAMIAMALTFFLVAPAPSSEHQPAPTPSVPSVGRLRLLVGGYAFASLASAVSTVLLSPGLPSNSPPTFVGGILVSWVAILGAIVGGYFADGGRRLSHPSGALFGGVGAAASILAMAPLLGLSNGAWIMVPVLILVLSAAVIQMAVLSEILFSVARWRRGLWLGLGLGFSASINMLAPVFLAPLANTSLELGASWGSQIVAYVAGLGALAMLGYATFLNRRTKGAEVRLQEQS